MITNEKRAEAQKKKPEKFDGDGFYRELIVARKNIATGVERYAIHELKQLSIDQPSLGINLIEPLLAFVQRVGERAAAIAFDHTISNGALMHHAAVAARSKRQSDNKRGVPHKPKPILKVHRRIQELERDGLPAKVILRKLEKEGLSKITPDGFLVLKGKSTKYSPSGFPILVTRLKKQA